MAVARVHGDIEEILALDQIESVDLHGDDALAVHLPPGEPLHRGVGAVAADPVLPENPDAEHRILDGPMGAKGEVHGAGLAGLEEVALLPVAPGQLDAGELDVAIPPPRAGARPRDRLGLRVLDAEGPGLLARHVVEVPAHDLARLAVGLEAPAIEPHRFVAEPLDAPEVMGDEHDRLAGGL